MKKLIWIFPILFLIDNILGLNGYHFTFFGIGIRIILFGLSMLTLCPYCLYTIKTQGIGLLKRIPGKPHILDYCRWVDAFVAGFLVLNCIWATVIPMMTHKNLSYSISDFNTVLVLALYFPCVFLMRTKQLNIQNLYKWMLPLLLLLALWHTVMYIGEKLAPGFYKSYYTFIDIISFGTAVQTDVVMGFGITRIIQTTSVFLIPAMLMILERTAGKLRVPLFAALALVLFAVLITYTKSIWFGILAGLIVAVAGILIFSKDRPTKKRTLSFCLAMVVFFCIFNFGCLNNTIITRTLNSVMEDSVADLDKQIADLQSQLDNASSDDPTDPSGTNADKLSQQLKELESRRKDAAGTAAANAQRAQQNEVLLKKWSESKFIGFGYGATTEDCIRNYDFPYMYESQLPALFMKLGLLGVAGWLAFVLSLVVCAVKAMWKQPVKFWCWIGTALAFAMAVQTNPFLFTFAGMSMFLYLLLFMEGAREEAK